MNFKSVFVNFWGKAKNKNNKEWENSLGSFTDEEASSLFSLIEAELVESGEDINQVILLGTELLNDIFLFKKQYGENLLISFLQFQIGARIAYYFTVRKMMTEIFSWVSNSLEDNIGSVARTVELERLDEFLQSDSNYIKDDVKLSLSLWTASMFYESRTVGGNNPVAHAFIGHYLNWYISRWKDFSDKLIYSFSVCQIQSWLIQHGRNDLARDIGGGLLQFYNSLPSEQVSIRKNIAMQFSSIDIQPKGQSRLEWCDIVLKEYSQHLAYHEKLQVQINKFRGKENLNETETVILNDAIDIYLENVNNIEYPLRAYEQGQIYSIMAPLLIQLSMAGNTKLSNKFIAKFFNIKTLDESNGDIIHFIPNDINGIFLCADGDVKNIKKDPNHFIPLITKTENEFLGTTTTLKDSMNFIVQVPERYGVPIPAKSEAYHEALTKYFTFEDFREFLTAHKHQGFYLFSGVNYPLQSIMCEKVGFTLPYRGSFSALEQMRPLKKVVVWKGESLYSELECSGLKQLLENVGIDVELLEISNCSKEDVITSYQNEDFDMVWCCGHGEFFHYTPHESYLELSANVKLTISELNCSEAKWSGRRLFFLNACDGATTSLYNSPISIGIGQSMITSKQSVFSHYWPVHPLAATIHAWLFGCFIRENVDPTLIYCKITMAIEQGKEYIISILIENGFDSDLIDRISSTDLPLREFYYWGSLSYFE
jgi:hypothetical protein